MKTLFEVPHICLNTIIVSLVEMTSVGSTPRLKLLSMTWTWPRRTGIAHPSSDGLVSVRTHNTFCVMGGWNEILNPVH